MIPNEINRFYYFGKLPDYPDFLGSAPQVLTKFLDFYGIWLNKQDVPARKEAALFCIPTHHSSSFLTGILWNSKDSFHRQYPFSLYARVASKHPLSFYPFLLLDIPKVLEAVKIVWTTLATVNLDSMKSDVLPSEKIAIFEDNALKAVSKREAVYPVFPSLPWYRTLPYFCLHDTIRTAIKQFGERLIYEIKCPVSNPEIGWFDNSSSYFFIFPKQSVLAECTKQYFD